MERDYDTPEGKERADDDAYMMPMEQRDPMMWNAKIRWSYVSQECYDVNWPRMPWEDLRDNNTKTFSRGSAQGKSLFYDLYTNMQCGAVKIILSNTQDICFINGE